MQLTDVPTRRSLATRSCGLASRHSPDLGRGARYWRSGNCIPPKRPIHKSQGIWTDIGVSPWNRTPLPRGLRFRLKNALLPGEPIAHPAYDRPQVCQSGHRVRSTSLDRSPTMSLALGESFASRATQLTILLGF